VTSSLGGGLVDGDRVRLDLDVGSGSTCLLTSQASQKVYRGTAEVAMRATVDAGGVLLSVPDPTVPYAGASFTQRAEVELHPEASLAWMDVVTAGRVARGERWASGRLDLSLTIARGGAIALRDRVLLDPEQAPIAPKMRRFDALATIVLLGPAFADLAAAVAFPSSAEVVAGAGTIDGGVVLRVATATVGGAIAVTRELLREPCARFGEDPFGRKW
jgi:urease accessory protein